MSDRHSEQESGDEDGKKDESGKEDGGKKSDDKKDSDKKDDKGDGKGEDKDKKESPLKNPKIRIGLIIAALVLLVALIAWLVYYYTWDRYQQDTNDAYLKVDQVTVSPQVPGYVTKVLVDDNQMVRAGQVLVEIDPKQYQARVDQALAQTDAATADIARYQAQIDQQQAMIAQAQANLDGARTNAVYDKGEVDRYKPLSAAGAETSEKLANLENSYNQAMAQVASNQAQLVSAQRAIETYAAQIKQGQAQVEQAQAQAKNAKIDLDYTIIHASMDGRVGDKEVRVGQYLQAGARIMDIVPLSQIYLEANFKETQIGLMRVGQPASIRVDALSGVRLRGHVASFSPGTGAEFSLLPPENATGNFTKIVQRVPVRIGIDADEDTRAVLVPGLSVEVTVNTIGQKDFPKRAEKEQKQIEQRDDQTQQQDGQQTPQPENAATENATGPGANPDFPAPKDSAAQNTEGQESDGVPYDTRTNAPAQAGAAP
jgi:membrane fusion protein (multidrug efflux system)